MPISAAWELSPNTLFSEAVSSAFGVLIFSSCCFSYSEEMSYIRSWVDLSTCFPSVWSWDPQTLFFILNCFFFFSLSLLVQDGSTFSITVFLKALRVFCEFYWGLILNSQNYIHNFFFLRPSCLWFPSVRQGRSYDSYTSLCVGEKNLLDNTLNISKISKTFRGKPLTWYLP